MDEPSTNTAQDMPDDDCQPSASKKPRLENNSPEEDGSQRRRSTRSARRSLQVTREISDDIEDEEVDDPDYQALSDSDDDPDFAPAEEKESSPQFTYRGRGKYGRGRGTPKGINRSHFQPTTPVSSPAKRKSDTPSGNENSGDGDTSGTTINGAKTVASPGGVKRRGRPLVFFNNNSTTAPQDSNKAAAGDDSTTAATPTSASEPTINGDTIRMVPAAQLHSTVNYPALKRQTMAVRLPEGPKLTPEQLKEIESQFKNGDFVMLKKDADIDNPPIWRIDGKSLLQKFQAFDKDGKTLYRNISTYSGWTSQGKTLYFPVKTKFIFQSRYDTVVELIDETMAGDDPPGDDVAEARLAIADKQKDIVHGSSADDNLIIPDELTVHMPTFEIFLQTLISQALDSNFLSEIYDENDEYFVDRVKVIEGLTDVRKEKIKVMTNWPSNIMEALEVWPSINIMNSMTDNTCDACLCHSATKLAQFYGQPYDSTTLKPRDNIVDSRPGKNYNVCDACSKLCQTYNTLSHRKYEYYLKCKATVTNIRVSQPSKNTTTILRELLGTDDWIAGLFRGMCTTLVRVDRLSEEYLSSSSDSAPATMELPTPVAIIKAEAASASIPPPQAV